MKLWFSRLCSKIRVTSILTVYSRGLADAPNAGCAAAGALTPYTSVETLLSCRLLNLDPAAINTRLGEIILGVGGKVEPLAGGGTKVSSNPD
jgi:hypothetical protein